MLLLTLKDQKELKLAAPGNIEIDMFSQPIASIATMNNTTVIDITAGKSSNYPPTVQATKKDAKVQVNSPNTKNAVVLPASGGDLSSSRPLKILSTNSDLNASCVDLVYEELEIKRRNALHIIVSHLV